jgi:hypothetical protein
MGEKADKSKSRALPAGSFFALSPGMAHFAYTDEDTVIQLNSTGPWSLTYVDPKDDATASFAGRMVGMRQTLTPRRARLLDIQGFDTVDMQELAPVAPWLRLAFGLCALLGGLGTVLASPTILLALALIAALAAASPVHPFDLIYNYGIRHLTGTGPLPRRGVPTRLGCGMGALSRLGRSRPDTRSSATHSAACLRLWCFSRARWISAFRRTLRRVVWAALPNWWMTLRLLSRGTWMRSGLSS